MALVGGWQIGPFETDFQQGGTIGAFQVGPFETDFQQGFSNSVVLANYVGQDWYKASYNLFLAGLNQDAAPLPFVTGKFQLAPPGQIISQIPFAGALIQAGGNVQFTVAVENLLGVNFSKPNGQV